MRNDTKHGAHIPREIVVQAPGRLCLLGEHQDYLHLDVISGALNLSVHLRAERIRKPVFAVHLKNTGEYREMDCSAASDELKKRDYLQSGLNLMLEKNFVFPDGFKIEISGDLPIGKGVSSSSALCVAWMTFLNSAAGGSPLSRREIAALAFQAEVVSFDEPGGMQDHLASAMGGIHYMSFQQGLDKPHLYPMRLPIDGFLLVDSHSTKETLAMIESIRSDVRAAMSLLPGARDFPAALRHISMKDITSMKQRTAAMRRLKATVINFNLVKEFKKRIDSLACPVEKTIGAFMNTHHHILSRHLNTSSERIDTLCEIARKAGALGAKVIGSGGGGCLLVYAPGMTKRVSSELIRNGASVMPVSLGTGVDVRIRN